MSKKDKTNKRSFFQKLFGGRTAIEQIENPSKVIWRNFLNNKLAIVGMVGLILIFSFSFIGGIFLPLDQDYQEPVLKNIAPSTGYLKYPSELKEKGIADLSVGTSFTIAADKDGDVHVWGTSADDVDKLPNDVKNAKIVKVAAGDRHALALDQNGKAYAWGYDSFGQGKIGTQVDNRRKMGAKIVDVVASDLYSGVLFENGRVEFWGSISTNQLDFFPNEYQEHITSVVAARDNVVVILDDGTLRVAGVSGTTINNVPEELMDGSVNVVEVAATTQNVVALDDKGNAYSWGGADFGLKNIPEKMDGVASVAGGRNFLTLVYEDGSVAQWGANHLRETSTPNNLTGVEEVYSGNAATYTVDKDGNIKAWGNDGYLLGTDELGRDTLARLMHGGRVTLLVGVITVVISSILGVLFGAIAGFKGGWVDNVIMRFSEVVSSIPFMPFVITLSAFLGNSMSSTNKMYLLMTILGFMYWPPLARLVRGQILIEREKDFVLAARALGVKEKSIIIRHIVPNVINILIVNMTLAYAGLMLTEASLSFLGFGVQAPLPSWGNMIFKAQDMTVVQNYWWQWVTPAICILIAALSINLIGDALRDAIDPRENEK